MNTVHCTHHAHARQTVRSLYAPAVPSCDAPDSRMMTRVAEERGLHGLWSDFIVTTQLGALCGRGGGGGALYVSCGQYLLHGFRRQRSGHLSLLSAGVPAPRGPVTGLCTALTVPSRLSLIATHLTSPHLTSPRPAGVSGRLSNPSIPSIVHRCRTVYVWSASRA